MASISDGSERPKKRRGPGRPFRPGQSGNPAGVPKEAVEFREALRADAPAIHAALMRLVAEGNAPAIIYAHQRVFGKPPSAEEDRDAMRRNAAYDGLTLQQLVALARKGDA